jgi:hypothetical protein
LLRSPFGLTLSSSDVNQFLADKVDKKLLYWTSQRLNAAGREVIANSVLISSMLYFVAL